MSITYKENMLKVIRHQEPDYLPLVTDLDVSVPGAPDFINEAPKWPGTNPDWFGQSWTFEEEIGGASPTPGRYLLEDISEWREKVIFPDLDSLDWEGYAARDTAGWDRANRLSRVIVGYGLWERMFSIMPFTEALCALVEEPEECFAFFEAVAEHKIRLHKKVIRYYKPDILVMHDDYGSNGGMFMAPETWRQLIRPHLQRVIDGVRDEGVYYEHHCCGYFAPILPEIVEMGAALTNTVHVSNHPAEIKKALGDRLTLVGGFDNQLIENASETDEAVRNNIRETVDALAGRGWIPYAAIRNQERKQLYEEELFGYAASKYREPRPGWKM